jgi:hypothetical protein
MGGCWWVYQKKKGAVDELLENQLDRRKQMGDGGGMGSCIPHSYSIIEIYFKTKHAKHQKKTLMSFHQKLEDHIKSIGRAVLDLPCGAPCSTNSCKALAPCLVGGVDYMRFGL